MEKDEIIKELKTIHIFMLQMKSKLKWFFFSIILFYSLLICSFINIIMLINTGNFKVIFIWCALLFTSNLFMINNKIRLSDQKHMSQSVNRFNELMNKLKQLIPDNEIDKYIRDILTSNKWS